jgi:trigger factor
MYFQFTGTTEADLNVQLETEAYKNTLYRLMLEEIKSQEKITATDKEAEEEAEKMAERYQVSKEDFIKQIGGLDSLKYDVEMNKTIEKLKELNKA